MSTFSRHPFISYDGPQPDENGELFRAEVKVVTGYGEIFDVEDSENKSRNPDNYAQKVVFKVDNSKYKSSGWAQSSDEVMKKVEEARSNGEPIHFRIETRRKKDIDRKTPINDLSYNSDVARENIHKSLAAVRLDSDEEWTVSRNAVTRLDEDPSGDGLSSANDYTLEELQALKRKQGGGNTATADRDWSNNLEAPPYILWLDDEKSKINLGSGAIGVPLSMYMYVTEAARKDEIEFTEQERRFLARAMVSAANAIQVAIFDGARKTPDMAEGSHVRARSVVFEVIRVFHPLSKEIMANSDNLRAWRDKIVESGTELLKWSIEETKLVSR